jgi:hypothetical protein
VCRVPLERGRVYVRQSERAGGAAGARTAWAHTARASRSAGAGARGRGWQTGRACRRGRGGGRGGSLPCRRPRVRTRTGAGPRPGAERVRHVGRQSRLSSGVLIGAVDVGAPSSPTSGRRFYRSRQVGLLGLVDARSRAGSWTGDGYRWMAGCSIGLPRYGIPSGSQSPTGLVTYKILLYKQNHSSSLATFTSNASC